VVVSATLLKMRSFFLLLLLSLTSSRISDRATFVAGMQRADSKLVVDEETNRQPEQAVRALRTTGQQALTVDLLAICAAA
jgi:hypothetical protein